MAYESNKRIGAVDTGTSYPPTRQVGASAKVIFDAQGADSSQLLSQSQRKIDADAIARQFIAIPKGHPTAKSGANPRSQSSAQFRERAGRRKEIRKHALQITGARQRDRQSVMHARAVLNYDGFNQTIQRRCPQLRQVVHPEPSRCALHQAAPRAHAPLIARVDDNTLAVRRLESDFAAKFPTSVYTTIGRNT